MRGMFSIQLTFSQYLIWPSVENMNANPDWLMPPVGKQESSPYDILIDLIPWYVSRYYFGSRIPLLTNLGLKYVVCYTRILKSIRLNIWWA